MNYTHFLSLSSEISLVIVMVLLLCIDIFISDKYRSHMRWLSLALCFGQTLFVALTPANGMAFGGMYFESESAHFFKVILSLATSLVFLQAVPWLKTEENKQGEYYVLTLATLLGMYFMVSAGNFLLFYIGIETASIPMAALIALRKRDILSAEASAKFILNAAFASGLSLFGLSLLYGSVGTLYFEDFSSMLTGTPFQVMSMLFFAVGIFFKVSMVPFHFWTADVYQGAPTPVTAYLSVISKGAAALSFFFIFVKVFGPMSFAWKPVLAGLMVLTITVGNLFAIRQKNIKRFMAFSSISQAGYLMLGVLNGTSIGSGAMLYYVLAYTFANLTIFGIISLVEMRHEKLNIDDYKGFYKTNPRLALAMMISIFSLAGIPPLAGFFSKFFIFATAAQEGHYILVFIALLNTVISLYYYLLLIRTMFIDQTDTPIDRFQSDPYSRLAMIIGVVGTLCCGLISPIYEFFISLGI